VAPDFVTSAVRSALTSASRAAQTLLGGAEHEAEAHSPIEAPLHEAVAAIHRAADSLDRQVDVLDGVAATLPSLTEALVKLTEQLGEVLHLAAPLEAAEREVAGIGHLFRRRQHAADTGPPPAPPGGESA
jgi:hypothetical protein